MIIDLSLEPSVAYYYAQVDETKFLRAVQPWVSGYLIGAASCRKYFVMNLVEVPDPRGKLFLSADFCKPTNLIAFARNNRKLPMIVPDSGYLSHEIMRTV